MKMRLRSPAISALLITFLLGPAAARAQTAPSAEERGRQLYEAAAYEDALTALAEAKTAEAQQYRALCLLALGRQEQARAEVNALVTATPDITVSEEMPPRFVTMLSQARRQLLPAILRSTFAEGREHYQKQEYEQAQGRFDRLRALWSQLPASDLGDVEDLRLLADGYLDLLKEHVRKTALPAQPAVVAATPSPPSPPVTTPPSPLKRPLPPWPIQAGTMDVTRVGLMRVRISPTGQVLSAAMVQGVNPVYDRALIAAASSWVYKAATRDGMPVESETTVEIRLDRAGR